MVEFYADYVLINEPKLWKIWGSRMILSSEFDVINENLCRKIITTYFVCAG